MLVTNGNLKLEETFNSAGRLEMAAEGAEKLITSNELHPRTLLA